MSVDKKLLSENTIRRFMKLANVEELTNNFVTSKLQNVNEMATNTPEEPEDEELKEQEDPAMDDEPGMDEPEMDEPEMDEPEMDDEPGAADMSLTEEEAQLLIDLGERLAAAMDEDMGDEDMDMGDEDMDMDDEPAMDDELDDEAPGGGYGRDDASMMEEDRDEIVQEVLKRVTKRIISETRR